MCKMTFTSPRATLDELLAFCQAVREAGGGNPLDALMPAVPEDPSQCLIAKNLNFNCTVDGNDTFWPDGTGQWVMYLTDIDVAQRIGERLGLEVEVDTSNEDPLEHCAWVLLPREIGQVAADFDQWDSAIDKVALLMGISSPVDMTAEDKQRFRDFWPYVEASQREAYDNATFVNERGELIL